MAIKDLIPWNNRGREVGFQRGTDVHPFFALHREMNRMFDDVFRGFDLAPFGPSPAHWTGLAGPRSTSTRRTRRCASPPNCPVSTRRTSAWKSQTAFFRSPARRKSESEDKARRFSERYYGRFERRIPLEDVEEDKASAAFKNGVLTITVPKSA